jgi:hypothetical protein
MRSLPLFPRVRDVIAHARQPLERMEGLEVTAQAGIHLRAVEHRLLAIEVHELLEREGRAEEIGRNVLDNGEDL